MAASRASTLKTIAKETDAETKSMKSVAIPVNNLFGGEEYLKVKKSDWNKIMDAFSRAVSRNYLLEKYEKKITALEKKIAILTDQIEKLKQFVASRGLGEAFVEFVKSLSEGPMVISPSEPIPKWRSLTAIESFAGFSIFSLNKSTYT